MNNVIRKFTIRTSWLNTTETKKKIYTNGQTEEWVYLRPWDSNNHNKRIYVKAETILKEVEKVFAEMHLDNELLKEVIAYIRMDRLTDLFLTDTLQKMLMKKNVSN